MRTDKKWSDAVVQLVKNLNTFNYRSDEQGSCNVGFYIEEHKVGIVGPDCVNELGNYSDVFKVVRENGKIVAVHIDEKLSTVDDRTIAMAQVLDDLKQTNKFFTLQGWRDEMYPVYYNRKDPPMIHIERSACPLFGVIQYGVHINGYTYIDGQLMMWIGKRSKTKQTYPNMLDNMCAGGLASNLGVKECAIKECQEEGSVDDETLTKLKPVGSVSYCYQDRRGILPEQQFIYDLEVSPKFVPKNADGEMQNFNLYTIDEIQQLIIDGQFKPNCALVIVDFLIRHGYIDADNDPNYPYIIEMMHKTLQPQM